MLIKEIFDSSHFRVSQAIFYIVGMNDKQEMGFKIKNKIILYFQHWLIQTPRCHNKLGFPDVSAQNEQFGRGSRSVLIGHVWEVANYKRNTYCKYSEVWLERKLFLRESLSCSAKCTVLYMLLSWVITQLVLESPENLILMALKMWSMQEVLPMESKDNVTSWPVLFKP